MMGSGFRIPDGWSCHACGNENYPRRTKCNRCGVDKPDGAPGDGGSRDGDGGSGHGPPSVRKHPPGVLSKDAIEKSSGLFKEGDWSCAKCGYERFYENNKCELVAG